MATVSASTQIVTPPTILDANFVVPVVVLAFIALNVSNDPKYAGLRSAITTLLQNPRQFLLEVVGFFAVALAVVGGLLLSPTGHFASPAELKKMDGQLNGLRNVWPVLLNPDGLLTIQQLLLGLGVALLMARGACSHGSNVLALGLALLSAAQGFRCALWLQGNDYVPEGPLGTEFAAVCSAIVLALLTISATKAALSARCDGLSIFGSTGYLAIVLAFCFFVAEKNHLTASDSNRNNVLFALVDAVDLSAAPFLAVAACSMASDVPQLGGALAFLVVAQTLGVWWFLDFAGLLADPNSEDPIVVQDLELKHSVMTFTHGRPYTLFAASHAVCILSAFTACAGYAVLRLSAPPGAQPAPELAPKHAAADAAVQQARPQGRPLLAV